MEIDGALGTDAGVRLKVGGGRQEVVEEKDGTCPSGSEPASVGICSTTSLVPQGTELQSKATPGST